MDMLWRYNVEPLLLEDVKPGDLVFITKDGTTITHGGLFVEWINEETFAILNASSYHNEVVIDTWPLESKKREQWLVGFGRLKTAH